MPVEIRLPLIIMMHDLHNVDALHFKRNCVNDTRFSLQATNDRVTISILYISIDTETYVSTGEEDKGLYLTCDTKLLRLLLSTFALDQRKIRPKMLNGVTTLYFREILK